MHPHARQDGGDLDVEPPAEPSRQVGVAPIEPPEHPPQAAPHLVIPRRAHRGSNPHGIISPGIALESAEC